MPDMRIEDVEALDEVDLQVAIDERLGALDRRASSSITFGGLELIEALLCAKIDRGMTLTVRERDILAHIEDARGDPRRRRLLILTSLLLAVTLCAAMWLLVR